MKTALFIDFEDSFTYNVIQELSEMGLKVNVINWAEVRDASGYDLIVLGPGPGHPEDYQDLYPMVENWLKSDQKIFAVCLGHQILWQVLGAKVVRSKNPQHGQKVTLNLDNEWQEWLNLPSQVEVQRYNSLIVPAESKSEGVTSFSKDGEIMMSRSPHFISYQFHPESVGTKCRKMFFRPILRDLL